MSVITITPIALAPGTPTPDIVGADADDAAVTTSDTFSILMPVVPGGGETRLLIVLEEQGGGASVVTFDAGDYPPASLAGKGADTVALATSDLKLYVPEAGRHMQNDGTIKGSVATNNIYMTAYFWPRGY